MKQFRVRFEYDDCLDVRELLPDDFFDNEEDYLETNPLYRDGKLVPFDEYKDREGDPDSYVVLNAILEVKCSCCGHWNKENTLGGITFYHWTDYATGTFHQDSWARLIEDQRMIAEELYHEYAFEGDN